MRWWLLFILLATAALFGCCPSHIATQERVEHIYIETHPREVVVRDTLFVEIAKESLSVVAHLSDTSRLSNRYANSMAAITEHGLLHTLETIPQEIEVVSQKAMEVRDTTIYRTITLTKTTLVERELSPWQRFQMRGFWVALIICALVCFLLRR